MAKILVVDDETDLEILIRQKFRKKIRANEYEFVFAINGLDALSKIQAEPDIDVVLSDINMPEMDGLTLLAELNDKQSIMKAVIVSAYGDMENIRTAMNRGAFDFITKPVDFKDLELTIEKTLRHVHQIRETIQAIKENNIMKMYVDETVINFMGGREYESAIMASETIEATVVFIDICSFTSISESVEPDHVVELLNGYFDVMAQEIIAHEGYIDKFIGDAMMAIFRDGDHLSNAISAALSINRELDKLPTFDNVLSFKPEVSIGINSGEMVSGNIGSESLRRLDYTVIGDVVNTAQRLQVLAQPSQIIINEETFTKAGDSFTCNELPPVQLKNKAGLTKVYEVVS